MNAISPPATLPLKPQVCPLVYRTWRAGGDVRLIAEQAKENERQSLGAGKKGLENSAKAERVDTRKELAKRSGLSHDTVFPFRRILPNGNLSRPASRQNLQQAKKVPHRPEKRDQNDPVMPERTAERLTKQHGVSAPTIKRDGKFAGAQPDVGQGASTAASSDGRAAGRPGWGASSAAAVGAGRGRGGEPSPLHPQGAGGGT